MRNTLVGLVLISFAHCGETFGEEKVFIIQYKDRYYSRTAFDGRIHFREFPSTTNWWLATIEEKKVIEGPISVVAYDDCFEGTMSRVESESGESSRVARRFRIRFDHVNLEKRHSKLRRGDKVYLGISDTGRLFQIIGPLGDERNDVDATRNGKSIPEQ
ncbi:MAG: hypothetical protein Aurels2KO_58170 [Aureliella sp.]